LLTGQLLLETDYFERFLAKKFQASKRFGIEGCESLIPGLFALIEVGLNARDIYC
jgi:2-oxoglutarate dehydrogenase E1 component